MELNGSRQIAADRSTVWTALNDPDVLKASIPGCTELTGSAEEGFAATVKQKVGPVSATFKGHVQLSNVVPGESYTISGEGKGGAAGFAKGGADVSLADEAGGTLLSYDVKAAVGGKLAQLGSRVIDGFSKRMADAFFENFKNHVEGSGSGTGAPAAEPDPAAAAPSAASAAAPVPEAPAASAAASAAGAPAAAQPEAGTGAEAGADDEKKPGWFSRVFGKKA